MTGRELYERHLAEAAPGTPLRALMTKVGSVECSDEELLAYARWELREAMYSLPPEPQRGDAKHGDGFHAGCCVMRAEAALRLLLKQIEDRTP